MAHMFILRFRLATASNEKLRDGTRLVSNQRSGTKHLQVKGHGYPRATIDPYKEARIPKYEVPSPFCWVNCPGKPISLDKWNIP